MARNRFVGAGTHRLDLSDGDWVDIKARLGVFEQKQVESAVLRSYIQGGRPTPGAVVDTSRMELRIDATAAFTVKLETYIVDWSFTDERGKHIKVGTSAIHALDPDTAEEIMTKLNDYLDEQERERKDPFTQSSSEPQSAS